MDGIYGPRPWKRSARRSGLPTGRTHFLPPPTLAPPIPGSGVPFLRALDRSNPCDCDKPVPGTVLSVSQASLSRIYPLRVPARSRKTTSRDLHIYMESTYHGESRETHSEMETSELHFA